MKVYFFDVRPKDSYDSVYDLARSFGSDIPHFLPLEGEGAQIVFCLNLDIDTIILKCQEYNFEICGLWEDTPIFRRHVFAEKDVDPAFYNAQHEVGITYFQKEHYVLEPIPKHRQIIYAKENASYSNSSRE